MPAYKPDTTIEHTSIHPADGQNQSPHLSPPSAAGHGDALNDHRDDAVTALHGSCGVYTRPALVDRLLDRVGWTRDADLANARLLEPGAGDGAFLVEAVRRLVASFLRHGIPLRIDTLRERLLAYELVPAEANKARARVVVAMKASGIHHATAHACARAWVETGDFLLADLADTRFSHIVGNPPYIRWSKLPDSIAAAYAGKLPRAIARGDLYLPFLHRSFELLHPRGRCAFVCSDRWRYTVYAGDFRARWQASLRIDTEPAGDPKDIFDRDVYVHPEILTATPRATPKPPTAKRRHRGKTLADLGCTIRVGPALGVTPAFVVQPGEGGVEPQLLHRWIDAHEVRHGEIRWRGRRVIAPFDDNGNIIELEDYPLFAARLERFSDRLRARHIVRNGAVWYRTIDKVLPAVWSPPKLLIPEIAKLPRVAVDLTGAVPSHGTYAVFSRSLDIEQVYDRLRDGKLAKALAPIAPKVKGRYTRCYRRFLAMITI